MAQEPALLCVGGPASGRRLSAEGLRYVPVLVTHPNHLVGPLEPTIQCSNVLYERMAFYSGEAITWMLVPVGQDATATLALLLDHYQTPPGPGFLPTSQEESDVVVMRGAVG